MSMRRTAVLLLACCAVLCSGCGVSSAPDIRPALGLSDGQSIRMPALTGKSYDEAVAAVSGRLEIERRNQPTDRDDDGTVLAQSVSSGTTVKRGSRLTLTVSSGREKADVPACVGMDFDTAAEELARAKLLPSLFVVQSDEKAWTVLRTEPEANTRIIAGSKVLLVISGGPDTEMHTLPSFLGKLTEEAEKTAAELGIRIIYVPVESNAPAGTVLEQSLPIGTSCAAGTELLLKVALEEQADEGSGTDAADPAP